MHGEFTGLSNIITGFQLTRLQNHFQVGPAAGFFERGNFIEYGTVFTAKKIASGNHHVNFIRSLSHRVPRLLNFKHSAGQSAGKPRGHGGNPNP